MIKPPHTVAYVISVANGEFYDGSHYPVLICGTEEEAKELIETWTSQLEAIKQASKSWNDQYWPSFRSAKDFLQLHPEHAILPVVVWTQTEPCMPYDILALDYKPCYVSDKYLAKPHKKSRDA